MSPAPPTIHQPEAMETVVTFRQRCSCGHVEKSPDQEAVVLAMAAHRRYHRLDLARRLVGSL